MACTIIKLAGKYLEWSSVCAGPVSEPMTRDEFETYYLHAHGKAHMAEFARLMVRVEAKGTSDFEHGSVDDTISSNRAGSNETELTKEQLIAALGIKE